jgi:hypothetical protein
VVTCHDSSHASGAGKAEEVEHARHSWGRRSQYRRSHRRRRRWSLLLLFLRLLLLLLFLRLLLLLRRLTHFAWWCLLLGFNLKQVLRYPLAPAAEVKVKPGVLARPRGGVKHQMILSTDLNIT